MTAGDECGELGEDESAQPHRSCGCAGRLATIRKRSVAHRVFSVEGGDAEAGDDDNADEVVGGSGGGGEHHGAQSCTAFPV